MSDSFVRPLGQLSSLALSIMVLLMTVLVGCATDENELEYIADRCTDNGTENCLERAEGALIIPPEDDATNGIERIEMVGPNQFDIVASRAMLERFRMGAPILRGIPEFGLLIGRVTQTDAMPDADAEGRGMGRRRVGFERTGIQDVIPRGRIRTRQRVDCMPMSDGEGGMAMDCRGRRVRPRPRYGTDAYRNEAARRSESLIASQTQALGVADCTDIEIINEENITVELDQCRFVVTFDGVFDLEWGGGRPDTLEAYLEMDINAALEVSGRASRSWSQTNERRLVRVATNFMAGPVPMYVAGTLYAGYNVALSGEANFNAGMTYTDTREFGIGWARGDGVHRINRRNPSYTQIGPTYNIEATVSADAYIRPELEVGVGYEGVLTAGVTAGLQAGADFYAAVYVSESEAEACASLELYLQPTLGYSLDILGLWSYGGDWPLNSWDRCLLDECPTCIGQADQVNPACETGCSSDAQCSPGSIGYNINRRNGLITPGSVSDAPDEFEIERDSICLTGTCAADGTDCSCAYAWIENCCTVDAHCAAGSCNTSTNRCFFVQNDEVFSDGPMGPGGTSTSAVDAARENTVQTCNDANADTMCDDGLVFTADTCVDGDCTHTSTREAGSDMADVYSPECASDDDCGEDSSESLQICSGGNCVSLSFDPCDNVNCNDGQGWTVDTCEAGVCSNTRAGTSTVATEYRARP